MRFEKLVGAENREITKSVCIPPCSKTDLLPWKSPLVLLLAAPDLYAFASVHYAALSFDTREASDAEQAAELDHLLWI